MINSLNGKILRLDPATGDGVSSNPFYSSASPRSASSRVWAMGFRNPFRFTIRPNTGSTNPATGDIGEIYIGDVGWNVFEELDIIKAPASNCGWPIFEGLTYLQSYASAITANKDEPNPLFGTMDVHNNIFIFKILLSRLLQIIIILFIILVMHRFQSRVAIPIVFFHRIPALDWKHGVDVPESGFLMAIILKLHKLVP
jgi:hypothetical protein